MASSSACAKASPPSSSSRTFSMRIVSMDYYMSPPIHAIDPFYSPFQGQSISEVPVIRFYGPTPAGQKTCLHLHGAFPYLYVPYDEGLPENLNDALAFVRLLASAVEKGLKMMNNIGAKRQHVHSCSLVRAKKFYGFHSSEQLFMKLVLYHPQDVSRLSTLLLGGGILNRIFQPYESHIPYLLQVLTDYNLAGMGFVHLFNIKFREPLPDYPFIFPCPLKPSIQTLIVELMENIAADTNKHALKSSSSSLFFLKLRNRVLEPFATAISSVLSVSPITNSQVEFWLRKTVPEDRIWSVPLADAGKENTSMLFRHSTCELEVDATVENILNHQELLKVPLERAGQDVKMVQSLIPIWEEEHERRGERLATCDGEINLSAERSFEVPLFEKEYQKTLHQVMHEWLEQETKISSPCSKGYEIESFCKDSEGLEDYNMEDLVNEEVVKTQLTQNSKETEQEAIELLRWMVHSQHDGGNSDSDNEIIIDEQSWSQKFESAGDALAKAVSDYESLSQQECQEILDCSEQNQIDLQDGTYSDEKLEPALLIPQLDGTFDEEQLYSEQQHSNGSTDGTETEVKVENLLSIGFLQPSAHSRKHIISPCTSVNEPCGTHQGNYPQHSLSVKRGSMTGVEREADIVKLDQLQHKQDDSLQETSEGHDEKMMSECGDEVSVRDLMRKKRKKAPPDSLDLDIYPSISCINGDNYSKSMLNKIETFKSEQTISMENKKCNVILSDSSRRNRNYSRTGESSSKYGALPIVKAEADAHSISSFLKHDEKIKADGGHDLNNHIITSTGSELTMAPQDKIIAAVDYSDFLTLTEAYSLDNRKDLALESRKLSVDLLACEVHQAFINEDSPVPDNRKNFPVGLRCLTVDATACETHEISIHEDLSLPVHEVFRQLPKHTSNSSVQHLQRIESNTNIMRRISEKESKILSGSIHSTGFHEEQSPPSMHICRDQVQDDRNYGETKAMCVNLDAVAPNIDEMKLFTFCKKPPSPKQLCGSFDEHNLPTMEYEYVFYGNLDDVPAQPANTIASSLEGKIVKSKEVTCLPEFLFGVENEVSMGSGRKLSRDYVLKGVWKPLQDNNPRTGLPVYFENDGTALFLLNPAEAPPSQLAVCHWLQEQSRSVEAVEMQGSQEEKEIFIQDLSYIKKNLKGSTSTPYLNVVQRNMSRPKICEDISQITTSTSISAPDTPLSQCGFRDRASIGLGQKVLVMSIEVFAETRGDLRPDPCYDAIGCIVLVMESDDAERSSMMHLANQTIVLLCDANAETGSRNLDAFTGCEVVYLKDEVSLLWMFIWLVSIYDPDILVGWEIQGLSLGLLAKRASNLGIGLLKQIARTSFVTKRMTDMQVIDNNGQGVSFHGMEGENDSVIEDEWGRTHGSGIYVGGRVVLNLWRITRSEVKLRIYTMEAVVEAVLKRKLPYIPWSILSRWFSSGRCFMRFSCVEYFIERAILNLQLINQLDLINRTAELARVFGIDFFSVISRGSQYRVESMMSRLAHTQNFLLIAPSKQQVAAQPAMECLPLVMEPESRFYTDPVVVLDFQSLYPSMIIAYNLCYSTCLGKVASDNPKVFGVSTLDLKYQDLVALKEKITFTPNGVMFVSPEIQVGVLPRLLQEILSTRIMVKRSIKELPDDQKVLQRVLNARQLALKLIANVTYGYTAAGFSGRMPCSELADSIVQYGRYTLERAIKHVNSNPHWKAHVVYGDTDSMFVLLKGRTREQAFKIGGEIASSVTSMNPNPVTLKMEKVYHPCILLTKKRYVGYSFEYATQVKPSFDAKGIETVRRDTCTAVAKMLERSLRILFETHDLSLVKVYVQRQWRKISSGRISLKDFIFAKEVRLGTYSAKASVLPPAAIVASKAMTTDPQAEPRYAERIPYIVVYGEPGARLTDMVVDPHALVDPASNLRLHDTYYITKQIIPALQRAFGLVGVDLKKWYNELPRPLRLPVLKQPFTSAQAPLKGGTVAFEANRNIFTLDNKKNQKGSSYRSTIDHYYLSQHCVLCGELIDSSTTICENCAVDSMAVFSIITGRRSKLEREFHHLQEVCRHCGGAEKEIERGISCISLDCSIYYERAKLQRELKNVITISSHCGFLMSSAIFL